MKGKRFTEEQIIGVLKEAEGGIKVIDLCREYGHISAILLSLTSLFGLS
jgi:putative transposase